MVRELSATTRTNSLASHRKPWRRAGPTPMSTDAGPLRRYRSAPWAWSAVVVRGLAASVGVLTVAAGCGAMSTPRSGDAGAVVSVTLPPPSQDGPPITVTGQASWDLTRPGCAEVRLPSGQTFTLVGPASDQRLGEVRAGTAPHQQRVQITGYIPRVGASVCGSDRSIVAKQVTNMDR